MVKNVAGALKKTRAHLTEEVIVDASLKLLQQQRTGDFTLAKIANALGVSAPSLYSHVPSKQYILERVRSKIVREFDVSGFGIDPWPQAMATWALSYADAFVRYPQTIPLLAAQPVRAPELLDQYERIVRALIDAGWPGQEALTAFWAVENFVLGSITDLLVPQEILLPEEAEYPTLARLLADNPFSPERAHWIFQRGLDALIAGLERRWEDFQPESSPPNWPARTSLSP